MLAGAETELGQWLRMGDRPHALGVHDDHRRSQVAAAVVRDSDDHGLLDTQGPREHGDITGLYRASALVERPGQSNWILDPLLAACQLSRCVRQVEEVA